MDSPYIVKSSLRVIQKPELRASLSSNRLIPVRIRIRMPKHNPRAEVALLILALTLTACGIGASNTAAIASSPVNSTTTTQTGFATTTAVPWINKPATIPTITTSPKPIPLTCTPRFLTVGSVTSGGGMGSAVWTVPITNVGSGSCSIPDNPKTITAVGPNGRRGNLEIQPLGQTGSISIPSGTSVTFMMQARDSCDPAGSVLPTNHYSSVDINLTTGVLEIKNVHLLLCDNQIFSGFQPQQTAEVPSPGSVASLSPHLQLPETIKAGSTLHYVVTLENQTKDNVSLAPCPVYQEEIFVPPGSAQKISRTLQLNCSSTHSIRPHSQVSFEMVITVPSQAGRAKFSWHIEPGGPSMGTVLTIGQ